MKNFRDTKKFKQEKAEIIQILVGEGVREDQAQTVADCFATADVFGVTSHGKNVLSSHVDKIRAGGYNLSPQIKVIKETSAFAVIDGDNSLGPVSAEFCVRYAIEKVKEVGCFTIFCRNNNTLGPAFYYPLLAAEQGLVAMVSTNSPAQMAPFGGKEKMLGTNPFAAVIPVGEDDPIIIDFATSVVAKSKFKEYANAGKPLPEGWALDSEGQPTTDAKKGIEGLVLPMAGFKGYGMSMLIDISAGLLSGSAYLNHVGRFYSEDKKSMNVGFYMNVLDPIMIYGEDYNTQIKNYVNQLRQSKKIDGKDIILPGDDRIKFLNSET